MIAQMKRRARRQVSIFDSPEFILFTRKMQRMVPEEFKGGMSVYEIATRHGCTILCVERLLRRAMGVRL